MTARLATVASVQVATTKTRRRGADIHGALQIAVVEIGQARLQTIEATDRRRSKRAIHRRTS
jgi:hypothetical protein